MRNKKGDYKYGIILSLILGVIVLSLSLYFIFQEIWSEDELDWEICRQSIQIRALLPDIEVTSFKDDYPLKCKTQVVEIEKSDVKNIEDAQKIIAETMARCWALYDKGDSNAFPAKFFKSSTCVPCARIHLTEEAKKYMEDKKMTGINIRESLMNLKMTKEYTYYEYLDNSGKKFSAFNFGNRVLFDLEGDGFSIGDGSDLSIYNSAEFYLGSSDTDLRVDILGMLGAKNYPVKDIDKLLLLSNGIIDVSGKINAILLQSQDIKVDENSVGVVENVVVSTFCKGKKYPSKCVAVEEYAKKTEGVVIKEREEDGSEWYIYVDSAVIEKDYPNINWRGNVELFNKMGGTTSVYLTTGDIRLPEKFELGKGDLIINYGIVLTGDKDFGNYIPFLFYFQSGDGKPFEEVKKIFVVSGLFTWEKIKGLFQMKDNSVSSSFCTYWEGIPA